MLAAIIGLIASGMLYVTALWQIEICTGWNTDQTGFDFPFYILKGVNRWKARDFWYGVSFAAWGLGLISGCFLGTALNS